jgi:hypothetical protein
MYDDTPYKSYYHKSYADASSNRPLYSHYAPLGSAPSAQTKLSYAPQHSIYEYDNDFGRKYSSEPASGTTRTIPVETSGRQAYENKHTNVQAYENAYKPKDAYSPHYEYNDYFHRTNTCSTTYYSSPTPPATSSRSYKQSYDDKVYIFIHFTFLYVAFVVVVFIF